METNEKSVAERNREMDEKRRFECVEALKTMGLGDCLHIVGKNPWRQIEKSIIRDTQGKAIICRNNWAHHVAKAMSEILGRKIERLTLNPGNPGVHVYATDDNITIPERHSIATMNRYFDDYRPGFHATDSEVNLPHALHALAAPANFLNEGNAYELTAALKEILPQCDIDATATDEGFAVVLQDEIGDLNGWVAERIAAIADIVEFFSLTPKKKPAFAITDEETGSSVEWRIAVAKRHTQQQRIEDGINAILAHLGHPEAEGDAHTLPEPKQSPASKEKVIGKKPSGKGKPKASA